MEKRNVNYKSDFVLRERFRNGSGKVVALPAVDFTLRYWTKPGHVYEASRRNGVLRNCVADGEGLLVLFKDHGLGEGELKHELHLALDNALFEDGVQNVYYPENMHLWLWDRPGDTEGVIESDCVAAYTRGFAFTFADFTAAEIEVLQRPATEAAERADAATEAAEAATEQARAATGDCQEATERAAGATLEAQRAKGDAERATMEADAATAAATASKEAADAATEAARQATERSSQQTERAKQATDLAQLAAETAGTAAERMEATNAQAQEIIERAEVVVSGVPTGLAVTAPEEITIGGAVRRYVRGVLKPDGVAQNILYLCGSEAVEVLPDGEVVARSEGTAVVHVVPTEGTRLYKTVKIRAVRPRLRLAGGVLRLDGNGNIRLT